MQVKSIPGVTAAAETYTKTLQCIIWNKLRVHEPENNVNMNISWFTFPNYLNTKQAIIHSPLN